MDGDGSAPGESPGEEWFGDWYDEPADLPFVVHLRRLCAQWLAGLVDPEATVHMQPGNDLDFGGSLLMIEVLEPSTRRAITRHHESPLQLQVLWDGHALRGQWADGLIWDGFSPEWEGALEVLGPSLTAAAAAKRTVQWLHEQLSRPLELRHWERSDGRPAFELWLTDTGSCIASRGWPWQRRGAPTTVTQVRPPRPRPSAAR